MATNDSASLAQYFDSVAAYVTSGDWRAPLTNDEKLVLYGLYKQATAGNAAASGTQRPSSLLNPVGAAKYDAWLELNGMHAEAAKAAYVDEFNRYRAKYGH